MVNRVIVTNESSLNQTEIRLNTWSQLDVIIRLWTSWLRLGFSAERKSLWRVSLWGHFGGWAFCDPPGLMWQDVGACFISQGVPAALITTLRPTTRSATRLGSTASLTVRGDFTQRLFTDQLFLLTEIEAGLRGQNHVTGTQSHRWWQNSAFLVEGTKKAETFTG